MDLPVSFTPIDPDLLRSVGAHEGVLRNPSRAIFANRDLNLANIKLVGFDMDYTLAIYQKLPMEQLQYDMTMERLIDRHGYPSEIRNLRYEPSFILRGLTVDKRNGHLLKTDTHGRVGRCYHGRSALTEAEIEGAYKNAKIRLQSNAFASVDTLFALPEVCLYANLVDFFESQWTKNASVAPLELALNQETQCLGSIDTWKLFDDVRSAIDGIHRDGSLKTVIMGDLSKYIADDPELPVMLHKLRSAGKRLFVLTNSYWQYTDALMSHLLDNKLKEYSHWRAYFDIILVGGRKPGFFTEREPFLELDVDSEEALPQRTSTSNPANNHVPAAARSTAGLSPDRIHAHTGFGGDSDTARIAGEASSTYFEKGKCYQGGNMEAFERMSQCAGEEVLYVGDHIFGDILRSKKDSRWRTALIVEELEAEMSMHISWSAEMNQLATIDGHRHQLDELIGYQRALLSQLELGRSATETQSLSAEQRSRLEESIKRLKREIDQAKRQLKTLDRQGADIQTQIANGFNPWWGRLLKEGSELSRFGNQVAYYADIYTSRVTNLLQYSPVHFFRAPREWMSHDRLLMDSNVMVPQVLRSAALNPISENASLDTDADTAQDLTEA